MSQKIIPLRWDKQALFSYSDDWLKQKIAEKRNWKEQSPWWTFIERSRSTIENQINHIMAGSYQFSPMRVHHFPDEAPPLWNCEDKLTLSILHQIIKPTFEHQLSPQCFNIHGINGVPKAIQSIKKALKARTFHYVIRIDIKSYYASIVHSILLAQINRLFKDPRLLQYLHDIVTIAIDNNAVLSLPTRGIPRRSSLSPWFGALYLSALDRAFEKKKGIFYARYMDDMVILCETKNQFVSAKKRLKTILSQLKLKLSPHKTKMGQLKMFHFLGVNFEVSQNTSHNKTHVTTSAHPRSSRRALDKASAMKEDAVHPAKVQHYLILWATWWKRAMKTECPIDALLITWVRHAEKSKNKLAWLGRGLLSLPFCSYDTA